MSNSYDLGISFGIPAGKDGTYPPNTYVSVSPSWILAVIRLQEPVTWDRINNKSINRDYSTAASERGETLIITSDCLSVSTSDNKGAHVTNLEATLIGGEVNYLVEIMPGDHIFCWMVNDTAKTTDLVDRIRRGEACNNFNDGLKFYGRVQGIRKRVELSRESGTLTVRYSIQAHGFIEFDSSILFIAQLAQNDTVGEWMAKAFGGLNKLIKVDPAAKQSGAPLKSQTLVQGIMDILLGGGIPSSLFNPTSGSSADVGQIGFGLTATPISSSGEPNDTTPTYAYIIPSTVGKLLGRVQSNNRSSIMSFYSIMDSVIGIQKYSNGGNSPGSFFSPDLEQDTARTSSRVCVDHILGEYLPQICQFDGKTVWSCMAQYLNPAINEMYNCLKVNPAGSIMPTLIARQLPFSSPFATNFTQDTPGAIAAGIGVTTQYVATSFLELPRWRAPPGIIYSFDVGRTDAMRTNFLHMTSEIVAQAGLDPAQLYLQNPPMHDDLDIARNGLRLMHQEIAVAATDAFNGPPLWNKIRSDMEMGQELTLTGQVVLQGIQDPICIGDNFDFGDGAVYHIEGVAHTCQMSGSNRTFLTVLSLTHGVSGVERTSLRSTDGSLIFAGFDGNDIKKYDPEITYAAENPNSPLPATPVNLPGVA